MPRLHLMLLIAVIVLGLAACGGTDVQTATRIPNPETRSQDELPETAVAVYYLKSDGKPHLVREIHSVRASNDLYLAAIRELTDGVPTTPGAQVGLPRGITCLGVKVDGPRADVRFSKELILAEPKNEALTLAVVALVNTLTEFEGIEEVTLKADHVEQVDLDLWLTALGFQAQPLKRNLSAVLEPAIWVTSPQPNETVANPVHVTGSALVDDGVVELRLTSEAGEVLAETYAEATKAKPERGFFEAEIVFSPPGGGRGFLDVFHTELASGEERDKVIIPIVFESNGKFTAGP